MIDDDTRAALTALAAHVRDLPAAELYAAPTWRACADAGLTGMPVDARWGGRSSSVDDAASALRAFARGGAPPGLVFGLGAQLWSVTMTIARFGTDEQRARWLPGLCDGTARGGHAMTEPATGSDAFGLSTTAAEDGDHVVIDGIKTFATNGPDADLFVVFATADRSLGWAGISTYVVARRTPGLAVHPLRTAGPTAAPMAEITFDACRVPVADRLGTAPIGMAIFTAAMELERSLLAAGQLGLVDARLAAARRHDVVAVERRAAAWIAARTSDGLVARAAARLDRGRKAPLESSLAKLSTSELWHDVASLGVDERGAEGMLAASTPDLVDGAAGRIYSGTSELQREMLGRRLGL